MELAALHSGLSAYDLYPTNARKRISLNIVSGILWHIGIFSPSCFILKRSSSLQLQLNATTLECSPDNQELGQKALSLSTRRISSNIGLLLSYYLKNTLISTFAVAAFIQCVNFKKTITTEEEKRAV